MDERAQRLAEGREDERTRYFTAKRAQAAYEAEIRLNERLLMANRGRSHDRNGIEPYSDETGFTPGARGLI